MDNVRIASTPTAGLRPLGSAGQRSHALLVDTLERHLSRAHAALFAEPVMAPDGASLDWYASIDGEPVPFPATTGALREEAQARLQRLTSDIVALASRLQTSARDDERHRGEALQRALEFPDESFIHIVDGHPILTGWAYAHEDSSRPVGNLSAWLAGPAAAPAVAPTAATPAVEAPPAAAAEPVPTTVSSLAAPTERAPFPWLQLLLWLLLALLLTLLFLRLVAPCGVGFPGRVWAEDVGLVDRCPVGAATADRRLDELALENQRGAVLRADIERLLREVAFAENACRQPPATPRRPAATPAPGPTIPADDEARAAPPPAPQAPAAPPEIRPAGRAVVTPADLDGERRDFEDRLEASEAADGDLTVTLKWNDPSDLDLAVVCPGGERLSGASRNACGGVHEIDANAADDPAARPRPVEHAFWASRPPRGDYRVLVTLYAYRETPAGTPIPFQVRVTGDEVDEIVEARVEGSGQSIEVLNITVP